MNRMLISSVLAALLAIPAVSQQPPEQTSLKGVVRLNKAPVSTEALRIKFPRPAEFKLSNGLAVMLLEDHRRPTFALELVIPASNLADPADLAGLSSATASMMTLGTEKRDARQMAEALAELGGSLNVSAGAATTRVTVSGLIDNMDALLDLFAEVLLHPSFPQDELDKWKQRQYSALQQRRTNPGFLAAERIQPILYPGDARGLMTPSEEFVKKLTRQHMLDKYKSAFLPGGSLIGIAGDVTRKEMTAKLESILAPWKGGAAERPTLALNAPIAEKKIILVHRPNSVQTLLTVANRAIARTDPDYIACAVMNRVLGQGPAARLFRNIREDKGYTYGISSAFDASRYYNDFSATTSVRSEVTGPALEELMKEFRDIRERAVPADELEGAKRAIVASFALSLESTTGLLNQAMFLKEYGFPADYWDRYPEIVMKVTADQVRQVARKYVPVDNAQIVAVGDAARIREVLRKFGAVEEYDAEGKLMAAPAPTR